MAASHDIAIALISADDLKLDDNPIPGSVLAGLAPIIKEMQPA
jgi:hypothetical protein